MCSPAAPSNDSTAIANALISNRRSRRSGRETCIEDCEHNRAGARPVLTLPTTDFVSWG